MLYLPDTLLHSVSSSYSQFHLHQVPIYQEDFVNKQVHLPVLLLYAADHTLYRSIGNTHGSLEVSGATTAVEETTEASSSEVTATDSDATWNRYPVGQCTWGVKEVAPWVSNWWGNGGDWAGSAASQGYAVGSTPVTGSIVCWTDGGYGHVGYVTQVDQDGQIQILESNYQGQQQINNYRGWFDPQNSTTPGSVSYIYPGA